MILPAEVLVQILENLQVTYLTICYFNLKASVSAMPSTWKMLDTLACPLYELEIGAEFAPADGNTYTLFSFSDHSAIGKTIEDTTPAQLYQSRDPNLNNLTKWIISDAKWYIFHIINNSYLLK